MHRIRLRLRWLILPVLLLMVVPLLAQDAPSPTATPIPIASPEGDDDSGAPGLPEFPGQPPESTQEVTSEIDPETTAEPGAAEATPDTTAPETDDAPPSQISESTCPTLVQEGFTATEIVCEAVGNGGACIGNGSVNATPNGNLPDFAFSSPGDRADLTSIDEIQLRTSGTENNAWTVIRARPNLNSSGDGAPVTGEMVLFGDVTLADAGQQSAAGGAVTGSVIAQFGMNVRNAPGSEGGVVWQLSAGEEILVTGITPARDWFRMQIPNRFQGIGWVYAPYIQLEGEATQDALPTVTTASPPPDLEPPDFGPMQAYDLLSATTPDDCGADIPDSGLLMQSPSALPDAMRFRVNGIDIELNGTAFITAQADRSLQVRVMEGDITVIANDQTAAASTGQIVEVPLTGNLQPGGAPATTDYDTSELAGIPIRLLPRQFVLDTAPLVVDESGADSASDAPAQSGFGTAEPQPTASVCILTAPDEERNIRSGPGTDYEVIDVLRSNGTVEASGRNDDEFNFAWYQTARGWIRFDTVSGTNACANLPIVDAPPPPEPTTPPATATPGPNSVTSSTLNQICPDGQASDSATSDGSTLAIALGGNWQASAGSSITVGTQGGLLRPEYGDYIRIVDESGEVLAGSGEGRTLAYTFQQNRNFRLEFSAANGDVVVMSVRCGLPD